MLLVSGAVGGLLALVGFRWHVGVLVLAFFGYTVFLYLFMPLEDRYILPAIPVLTLLAGGGAAILGSGSFRRVFVIRVFAVVMLALMYAGWNVTTFNGLLNAPDSRERAIDWVAERATADDGIVLAMNPVKLPAATSGLKVQADFMWCISTGLRRMRWKARRAPHFWLSFGIPGFGTSWSHNVMICRAQGFMKNSRSSAALSRPMTQPRVEAM